MDERLKPCPFCGAPYTCLYWVTTEQFGYDTLGIFCNNCKHTVTLEENEWEGDTAYTKLKAIKAWNKRDVRDAIMQEPTAEPEIIHCKECGRYIPHDKRCGFWNHGVNIDWSCSQGERR